MMANTSRSTWPDEWGKEHHAFLKFHDIFARQDGDFVWLLNANEIAFARVPVSMEWRTLKDVLLLLRETYELGYGQGRKDLAAKILSPINDALQQNQVD